MATIKQIQGSAVHQIQSGQVIVDLCSVVKELVENSLDAGATIIDVRFKNQGLDSIEVQDNGDGIASHNYEATALKHYTSKLSTYSDLTTLQTFGFRGEALSSLCALSKFSITTCIAADAPKGTRLEFEVSGELKGKGVVAAQKGTTVVVENLFNNLPVRRRELERNIKREWGKVVGVLGQYACIQTGIKFSVTQQPTKGKKTTMFLTKGNQSTRENIVNVFGAKTLTALVPLDLNLELEATSAPSQRWSTQDNGGDKKIHIVGHISRPAFGEGRQTPDKQMFFVNARPCGLPQVAKAFNEVYKSYNASQSPFVFANIELDTHLYDVNVSPGKRTILLHDQSRMLENLKVALVELFESQDYTVPISQLLAQKQPSLKQLAISREKIAAIIASQTPAEPTVAKDPNKSPSDAAVEAEARVAEDDAEETIPLTSGSSTESNRSRETFQSSSHDPRSSVKRNAVNRESLDRDTGALNLLSNWMSKKPESRTTPRDSAAVKAENKYSNGISKDKLALIEKMKRDSRQAGVVGSSDDRDSSVAPSHNTDSSQSFTPGRINQGKASEHAANREQSQSQIPALSTPCKLHSTVLNAFSQCKAPRPSSDIATITIGDRTVISPIGAPYAKRQRAEIQPSSSGRTGTDNGPKPLPSFGKLSQRFGAPGTQQTVPSINGGQSDGEVAPTDHHGTDLPIEEENGEEKNGEENEGATTPVQTVGKIDHAESSLLNPDTGDDDDGECIDEETKKLREEAKVQEMIEATEKAAMQPSQEKLLRAKSLLKGGGRKKGSTLNLQQTLDVCSLQILHQAHTLKEALSVYDKSISKLDDAFHDTNSDEEKLSLTISKDDFAKMKIIGQFNLGFILATRAAGPSGGSSAAGGDELFIIDQHASDEKFNFERLQASTIVQSQRLVQPKPLDLTAIEEEVVIENLRAIEANGFIITIDQSGDLPVGQRCQLVSLPVSSKVTFTITDLEELLALLIDKPVGTMPRPSKVRKMFAMRACRSSIMIGRTLTVKQMGKVVKNLGELDKPWNCPHGRPTMRHLCGLGSWDEAVWQEGDDEEVGDRPPVNWAAYTKQHRSANGEDEGEEEESDVFDEQ